MTAAQYVAVAKLASRHLWSGRTAPDLGAEIGETLRVYADGSACVGDDEMRWCSAHGLDGKSQDGVFELRLTEENIASQDVLKRALLANRFDPNMTWCDCGAYDGDVHEYGANQCTQYHRPAVLVDLLPTTAANT